MSRVLPKIEALGTTWLIELFEEIPDEKNRLIYDETVSFLTTFNNSYSRFRDDSLLSELNNKRILNNPPTDLIQMLEQGQNWYHKTGGVFNIMVESELVRRGYDADYSFVEKVGMSEALADPTTDLIITPDLITLNQGRIDLGGLGKGYAIDRLVDLLQSIGLKYFLINGGGDIYATSDNGSPIIIYLEHPTERGTYLGETTLLNEAFASSSQHKRQWRGKTGNQNHLVQKDEQVQVADATYVKALTATVADILATTSALSSNVIISDNFPIARYYIVNNNLTHSSTFTPLILY